MNFKLAHFIILLGTIFILSACAKEDPLTNEEPVEEIDDDDDDDDDDGDGGDNNNPKEEEEEEEEEVHGWVEYGNIRFEIAIATISRDENDEASNITLTLSDHEGQMVGNYILDFELPSTSSNELEPGTFIYSEDPDENQASFGMFLFFSEDDIYYPKSGTLEIGRTDQVYTITFDVVLSNDVLLSGYYEGEVGYGRGHLEF